MKYKKEDLSVDGINGVSGGGQCYCTVYGVNPTPLMPSWISAIMQMKGSGVVPGESDSRVAGALKVLWTGETTKSECINKCCEEIGSTRWLFGATPLQGQC